MSSESTPRLRRADAFLMDAEGGGGGASKRFKFTRPPARPKLEAPSTNALVMALPSPKKPPAELRKKIGEWTTVAGIAVQTAGWDDIECIGGLGQHGFYSVCSPAKMRARIIAIGWAVGSVLDDPVRKERLVQPSGFQVQGNATYLHGISHEKALREGLPLRDVLTELLDDMREARRRGGRLLCHHMEFTAGLIANEMDNAGLESRKAEFADLVREGLCSMDPDFGLWLRQVAGMQIFRDNIRNIMKFTAVVDALRPYRATWPAWRQHVASEDARMLVCVLQGLLELLTRAE